MVSPTLDFYDIYYLYDNSILPRHLFQGHCNPYVCDYDYNRTIEGKMLWTKYVGGTGKWGPNEEIVIERLMISTSVHS